MKQQLVIIGAGNVGAFLAYNLDLFDGSYELLGFLDDDSEKNGKKIAGYPVLGQISDIFSYPAGTAVAIGIASPTIRKRVADQIIKQPFDFPNFIAKNAWISNLVNLGCGVIIYPGVSINYESSIGHFVIMNMNCAIGHNATIGNYCTLAPGVNFAGFTHLDECVDVGIGVSTRQNVRIGTNSVIGGQSMVISNVPANSTIVGVPGRAL